MPYDKQAAARAYARAAAVEKAEGACVDLDCGHLYVPPQVMRMPHKRGMRYCEQCGEQRAIKPRSKHPDGRCEKGCAWCVDDPRELF